VFLPSQDILFIFVYFLLQLVSYPVNGSQSGHQLCEKYCFDRLSGTFVRPVANTDEFIKCC